MKNAKAHCFVCNKSHSVFGLCPAQSLPSWVAPPDVTSSDPTRHLRPDLAKFLEKVWSSRSKFLNFVGIYDLYNAQGPGASNPLSRNAETDYFAYLDALQQIHLTNDATAQAQNYGSWSLGHLIEVAKGQTSPFPQDLLANVRGWTRKPTLSSVDAYNEFKNDFFSDFFHFLKYDRPGCIQRVYVNVKADSAIKVFKYVVNSLVGGLPGVDEAKVAGPRGVGERSDSIVIYSKSVTTTNAVLERLTEYQRLGNQNCFGQETPHMTSPAAGLRGVAVGAEPNVGQIEMSTRKKHGIDRESFGSIRAKLIYNALAVRPKNKDAFLRGVVRNFADAKLSPLAPHI